MSAGKPGSGSKLFLAAMAGGLALSVAAASLADESWIHTGPEYGMAQALEDHIVQACAQKIAPDVLILGDSRAVAGVPVQAVREAGLSAEKFALGGAGIFAGWAMLDRLVDCGVRPKTVVMAYGSVHMTDVGAIMDRTTNYDVLRGPRASHAYDMLSRWEDRLERRLAYKAISIAGTGLTLVDLVLMRPALRNVLERPPQAIENRTIAVRERTTFAALQGDRYYGQDESAAGLPDEARFEGGVSQLNLNATAEIAALGRTYGFGVLFYVLPVSERAMKNVPPHVFETAREFRTEIEEMGVRALNDVWSLPDSDFGDPSHVNARGRTKVAADFLARLMAEPSLVGAAALRRSGPQRDDAVTLAVQEVEKVGQ
jgi:hypothetical protein